MRTYTEAEALEYCKRAAEANKKLMMDALKDTGDKNPQLLAWNILAHQFFTQRYTEWDIYVPNMIKGLADGTWREHFEDENNESK